jgi:hypothetical protein
VNGETGSSVLLRAPTRPADQQSAPSPPHGRDRWQFFGLVLAHFMLAAAGIVTAYAQAKHSTSSTHIAIFWLSYFVAVIVTLAAGCFRYTRPGGQLSLLIGFGAFTYLPKFLMSVSGPVYFDEYGHWRQVNDIVSSGHLAPGNAYLPIVKYYPGLETLTAFVHFVTRLSTWHSGQIVILIAHCASLVVVYQLARTVRLAPIPSFLAALIFSLNPSFLYFDSQYSYESLGLPLAFATLLCVLRARTATSQQKVLCWTAFGVAAALMCITTHHISALVMTLCCVLATIFVKAPQPDLLTRRRAVNGARLVAITAAVGTLLWFTTYATPTKAYVAPHVEQGVTQVFNLLGSSDSGQSTSTAGAAVPTTSRSLFSGPSAPPIYERGAAFATPALALVAVIAGVVVLLRRRDRRLALRQNAVFLTLCGLYFASLPLTLTSAGSETAHRSWAFTYVGLSLIAATALSGVVSGIVPRLGKRGRAVGLALGSATLVIAAMGNVTVGVDLHYRFPGPATFGVDTRFETPELKALAGWAAAHLPAGGHVVTDRFTGEELTAYTSLDVPRPDQNPVFALYREGLPSPVVDKALRAGNFRYFILDKRVENQLPQQRPWPGYQPGLVNTAALQRLNRSTFAQLIYRSQNYLVYRINPWARPA